MLGIARGGSHLPLGHQVVHTGFRQKPLLPTFLEEEVCKITAVRGKDDEGTGCRAGIPEGAGAMGPNPVSSLRQNEDHLECQAEGRG